MPQQSWLGWIFSSLGIYSVLLLLALMFSFALTLLLVWRGRGGWSIVGLILVVPIPLWVGILGTIIGCIQAFNVIATSSSAPDPSLLAEGISTAMVSTYVGAVLVVPNLLVATLAFTIRSSSSQASETILQ